MNRKSYFLFLTVVLFAFLSTGCLPLMLLNDDEPQARKTGKKTGAKTKPEKGTKSNRNPGEPVVLEVDKNINYVNAMGKETPEMPEFDELSPEPGKVRGYVLDLQGNPLKGAHLGVRSTAMGGFYSGSQGETDADGYYEFEVPSGVAHFYNAGYAVDWGESGLAALGLHPVDGKLDSFASTTGGVENFVLLPYGITSRENLQQSPHLASTYYGGSVYFYLSTAAAGDNFPMTGAIVEGTVVEVTLTPEGEMFQGSEAPSSITVRKAVGFTGGFYINNIPPGQYRLSIKTADGEPLKMELNKPRNSEFGIKPTETTDEAVLTFAPSSAAANSATPQYGGWSAVEINVSRP